MERSDSRYDNEIDCECVFMKVLFIVAHPDDELLGCGGTLIKHIEQGDQVYVCVVTAPTEPRWDKEYIIFKEFAQKAVDKFLGITIRYNLDYPTARCNIVHNLKFNTSIGNIINDVNPDIIYTHGSGELHIDHQLTFTACLVETRTPKRIKLISFETTESYQYDKPFAPNYYVDITPYIDKKIEALQIYSTEIMEYPHKRSAIGIKNLSMKRGMEMGVEYAECFKIIRDWWL